MKNIKHKVVIFILIKCFYIFKHIINILRYIGIFDSKRYLKKGDKIPYYLFWIYSSESSSIGIDCVTYFDPLEKKQILEVINFDSEGSVIVIIPKKNKEYNLEEFLLLDTGVFIKSSNFLTA